MRGRREAGDYHDATPRRRVHVSLLYLYVNMCEGACCVSMTMISSCISKICFNIDIFYVMSGKMVHCIIVTVLIV